MPFINSLARRVPFLLMVLVVLSAVISIPSAAARSTVAVPAHVRAELKQDGNALVIIDLELAPEPIAPHDNEVIGGGSPPNGKGPDGNGPPGQENKPGTPNPPGPGGNNPNGKGPKGKGPDGNGPPGPSTAPNGQGNGNGPFGPYQEVEPTPPTTGIEDGAQRDAEVEQMLVAAIAELQNGVLADLPPGSYTLVQQYSHIPALSLEVNEAALNVLAAHPDVIAISPNAEMEITHSQSIPLINADDVHLITYNSQLVRGIGVQVAVIDTGVDLTHADTGDAVIYQYCYDSTTPNCPGGVAEAASAPDYNGHGTHVTGTITADGDVAPRGVAPSSQIIAMRVGGAGGGFVMGDVLSSLNHLLAYHETLGTDVVNMSLGQTGFISNSNATCDANFPGMTYVVNKLVNRGVVLVAASGNDASTAGVGYPACMSQVISVGGSYDTNVGGLAYTACSDASSFTDKIACFTNRSSILDVMAPGSLITSAANGGGTAVNAGTSMASPHVAGVAALLKQVEPTLTPLEVETILKTQTASFVSDAGGTGLTFPRVDALMAVNAAMTTAYDPKIIFVRAAAAGANNGTSWANAYVNLQDGLRAAGSGDQIWVASGRYFPDRGVGRVDNARTESFHLKDNVRVLGGFAGNETAAGQRNPAVNISVLSGDIDGNDTVNGMGVTTGMVGNNSYHVVDASFTNSGVQLDGFVINAGSASLNDPTTTEAFGGGIIGLFTSAVFGNLNINYNYALASGGGIYLFESAPYITTSLWQFNWAENHGGGMFLYDSDATITNSQFYDNITNNGYGGGLVAYGAGSQPRLISVVFYSNNANNVSTNWGRGAGMASWNGATPVLRSVGFYDNVAEDWGGGLYVENASASVANAYFTGNEAAFGGGIFNRTSAPVLTNVTLAGNTATSGGGAIYNFLTSPMLGQNMVIWSSGTVVNDSSAPTFTYSLIEGGCPAGSSTCTSVLNSNPLFVDADGADNNYGTFDDSPAFGAGSPAIDSGNNNADLDGAGSATRLITDMPYDYLGYTRRVNITTVADTGVGTAPIVDRGAYEHFVLPFTVTYNAASSIRSFTCTDDGLNYQCYFPLQIAGLTNGRSYTFTQIIKPAELGGGGYRTKSLGTMGSIRFITTYTAATGATVPFYPVLYTKDDMLIRDLTLSLNSGPMYVEFIVQDNVTNQCVRGYYIYSKSGTSVAVASGTEMPTSQIGENRYGCGMGWFPAVYGP